MTAKFNAARAKRGLTQEEQRTGPSTYTKPILPKRPKIGTGPACYGRTKNGQYIVNRFYVIKLPLKPKARGTFYVMDADEGLALGSRPGGYPNRSAAVLVAKKFQKEYGCWSRMPF